MIKYLLPKEGQFYKANLHCHSTMSDGKLTPEEIKEEYMKRGYSVVAITDHELLIPHLYLQSEDFLPLIGTEIGVDEPDGIPGAIVKTLHSCMIAIDPENINDPLWNRNDNYTFANIGKNRCKVSFDENKPDFIREYSAEGKNAAMKEGKDHGFFVTYNHPRWSLDVYNDYITYDGMHALEIYNHGCYVNGHLDYVPEVYDEILRTGKKIYCIAADDNHNGLDFSSPRSDSFGGFTMIKAPSLEYKAVTNALVNGDFYASRGPLIEELWYDNEEKKVHIKTSDAKKIVCSSNTRLPRITYAVEQGKEYINEAVFDIKEYDIYFRLTVYDENGLTANTNAYFVEDL